MSFSSLPLDIIHHILSYDGTLKNRSGKYMGQISKTDKRYELLHNIERKIARYASSWYEPNRYYILRVSKTFTIQIWIWCEPYKPKYVYNYRFNNRVGYSYTLN